MATIDSLDIVISASMEKASQTIDNVIKGLGLVAEGMSAVTKNSGLEEFSRKAREFSTNIADMGKKASESMRSISDASEKAAQKANGMGKSVSESMKPVSKSARIMSKDMEQAVSEFQNKFKDLGKDFSFAGTTERMRSETDKIFNNLEKARVDLQRLTLSDNIDSSQLERAVAKVMELQNKYESLQKTLEGGNKIYRESLSRVEERANSTRRAVDYLANETEYLKSIATGTNYGEGVEGLKNQLSDYENRLKETLQSAKKLGNDGATKSNAYVDAIARVEKYRDKIRQLKAEIQSQQSGNNGFEISEDLSGTMQQLRNMGDLISQIFSDLKSGEIWSYLSDGAKDYVKNAQLASGIKVNTEEYQNVLADISRAESALEKLEQKKRDMEAAGTDKESKEWQNITSQIEAAQKQLGQYTGEKYRMEGTGKDTEFAGGLANQSILKSMGAVAGEAMSSLRQKIGEIGGAASQAVGNIPIIGRVAKESAFLGQTAFNGLKFAISGIPSAVGKAVNAISTIASGIQKLIAGIKSATSKLSSMAKSLIGIKNAGRGMNASFAGGLKTILRYGLGIRSLYTLINKLRTAMKDSFKNLAQYSSETNASLSMLQSSLGALKNSLSVAFAPIVNVVAPYLSAFIDMITRAFNAVGRFFAALTGKSFAAQAVKNFSDYADSLKNANGAAEKLYSTTLGIDELNINAGDQSAGGGGGGASDISAENMFETVSIESDMLDFVQKIKDAWTESDFTEIGSILGAKLRDGLDGIEWEQIKESAAKIGKSIGTLINGFVETDGLAYSIGQTIGEIINTGVGGANAFFDSTHWDSVGTFIGDGLNGLVDTIDWGGVGHLFAAKWNALFETIGNAAVTFDWSNFGLSLATSVNTFITDFDWAENGAHLGELAKGLLDTLITFLEETDWQELGNGIADFIGGVDWGGILERLSEGIGAALGGLAALLWGLIEDAWDSVVGWWEETAFEDGQFTITGLLNGIAEGAKDIAVWITEHVTIPFLDGLAKAFGLDADGAELLEIGSDIVAGFLEGILESMKDIGVWLLEHLFTPFTEAFKELFDIHSPSGVMEEQGEFLMEGLFNGISSLADKVVGVFTKIKDKIVDVWNTVKTKTTEIWEGIKNAIKTPINGIIGFINKMISGVVSGINSMTSALNNMSFSIPEWIPGFGGKTFGLNIPQISAPEIPMLANGAVIRGGNPFMAILGDQPVGHTNIEAPLDTIKQAVREELYSQNYSHGSYNSDTGEIIRKVIHEEVAYIIQEFVPYLGDISQNTRETADKDMSLNLDGRDLISELDKKNQSMGFDFRTGSSRGRIAF